MGHPILGTWGDIAVILFGHPKEAKDMPKLLVTCNINNQASEKTILANGGVFEKTIDVDGSQIKRYWILVK